MYEGREWTQGPHPTCVAASTVTARAMVDPLYALQLTTGGRPGDPAHDSPQAFEERLRDEQVRVYDGARPASADWPVFGYDGMRPGQGNRSPMRRSARTPVTATSTGSWTAPPTGETSMDKAAAGLPDVKGVHLPS